MGRGVPVAQGTGPEPVHDSLCLSWSDWKPLLEASPSSRDRGSRVCCHDESPVRARDTPHFVPAASTNFLLVAGGGVLRSVPGGGRGGCRLHTIAFYDRVLVLSQGRVVEYDTPLALIDRQGGEFRAMCEKVRGSAKGCVVSVEARYVEVDANFVAFCSGSCRSLAKIHSPHVLSKPGRSAPDYTSSVDWMV